VDTVEKRLAEDTIDKRLEKWKQSSGNERGLEKEQIAKQMKRLREERGLSQIKLSAIADLTPATVNRVEKGVVLADAITIRKLARALGVSLAELLGEES
jgi:ribosome-binding protein aMBF1 (putative translation factor)